MDPTKISVRLGATVNLGDFESLRLDIEVTDHVRDGVDFNAQAAIDRIHKLVEKNVVEKIQDASGKKFA
jgi:hypothetical protein